jgi:aminopeptidase N
MNLDPRRVPRRAAAPAALLFLMMSSCAAERREARPSQSPPLNVENYPMDIHTFSRPNEVASTHVSLNLTIDFARKELRGSAKHTLSRRDAHAPFVVDVQGLVIERVVGTDGGSRKFECSPEDKVLGSALSVQLLPPDSSVEIYYKTTDRSDALQWLDPAQTAGRTHPFLFTQGQSIFTRTWIPLQDSPSVRITYDAQVRTASADMVPVMSAHQRGRRADGFYGFSLDLPIPPYLIALACGNIQFRAISPRCGIWAEPVVVDSARAEFEDTEKMVAAVERVFGPYRWDRYDILVLPPAFPFGGMENPMLTFATPTVLAGDKSLVSLVAHELSHSWSGNLVTNATWSDFWLNEGFTMYLEGRVMEEIYGKDRAWMEQERGRADLLREMRELPPDDQILYINLKGRHPDDGFSSIPYEKAALFLRRIEQLFGRPAFDRFLSSYFADNAFRSITTADFVEYLKSHLLATDPRAAAGLNLQRWLHEPGLPDDAPVAKSRALAAVEQAVDLYKKGSPPESLDTSSWVTLQWVHFINQLPADATAADLARIDAAFHFTESKNSEILGAWLRLAVEKNYTAADRRTEEFLMSVGRRKYLKPIYSEYARTSAGKARAREIYSKARPMYHAISRAVVDKILQ